MLRLLMRRQLELEFLVVLWVRLSPSHFSLQIQTVASYESIRFDAVVQTFEVLRLLHSHNHSIALSNTAAVFFKGLHLGPIYLPDEGNDVHHVIKGVELNISIYAMKIQAP